MMDLFFLIVTGFISILVLFSCEELSEVKSLIVIMTAFVLQFLV